MKKKAISAALAGALAVSLLSACSSSSEPQNIADVTSSSSEAASSSTTQEAAEPASAQEMTFVLNNTPDGLDPGVTNNSFAQYVIINCFEGLVTYDESGSLVGGSAESWDVSDDGTVYTFHLRDGLKWSDGTPLTASDFVYAIQRVLTPETTAQYVSMVTGYVKGAQEYYDGTGTAEDLGVKAIDDQTLEITLLQPTSYFIDVLSMWVYDPVQQATVEANGDSWTTSAETYICNGPFKVTEMNANESEQQLDEQAGQGGGQQAGQPADERDRHAGDDLADGLHELDPDAVDGFHECGVHLQYRLLGDVRDAHEHRGDIGVIQAGKLEDHGLGGREQLDDRQREQQADGRIKHQNAQNRRRFVREVQVLFQEGHRTAQQVRDHKSQKEGREQRQRILAAEKDQKQQKREIDDVDDKANAFFHGRPSSGHKMAPASDRFRQVLSILSFII